MDLGRAGEYTPGWRTCRAKRFEELALNPFQSCFSNHLTAQDYKVVVKSLRTDLKRLPRRRNAPERQTMRSLMFDRAMKRHKDMFEKQKRLLNRRLQCGEEAARKCKERLDSIQANPLSRLRSQFGDQVDEAEKVCKIVSHEIQRLRDLYITYLKAKKAVREFEEDSRQRTAQMEILVERTQRLLRLIMSDMKQRTHEAVSSAHGEPEALSPGPSGEEPSSGPKLEENADSARPTLIGAQRPIEPAQQPDPKRAPAPAAHEAVPHVPIPWLMHGNKYSLRTYQREGLDWLAALFRHKLNGILADEMGLGKTIETIALLAHIAAEYGIWGPHLIVVPTSVLLNWEREFNEWAPQFRILLYVGTKQEREQLRKGWTKPGSFFVCITSYRIALADSFVLRRRKWAYLILDEAHNIKNYTSKTWETLLSFNTQRRLLLTGTPLQNNMSELWALLHFVMPHFFESRIEFLSLVGRGVTMMAEGEEALDCKMISEVHAILRPFLMRRLKRDVEIQLPPKHEHIVPCPLSKWQRILYEDYIRNGETRARLSRGNYIQLANVLMQLRKVCNHPSLFKPRAVEGPFIIFRQDTSVLSRSTVEFFKGMRIPKITEPRRLGHSIRSVLLNGPHSVSPSSLSFTAPYHLQRAAATRFTRNSLAFLPQLEPFYLADSYQNLSMIFLAPDGGAGPDVDALFFQLVNEDDGWDTFEDTQIPCDLCRRYLGALAAHDFDIEQLNQSAQLTPFLYSVHKTVLDSYLRAKNNFVRALRLSQTQFLGLANCFALHSPVSLGLFFFVFCPEIAYGLSIFSKEFFSSFCFMEEYQHAACRAISNMVSSAETRLSGLVTEGFYFSNSVSSLARDRAHLSLRDCAELADVLHPGLNDRLLGLFRAPFPNNRKSHYANLRLFSKIHREYIRETGHNRSLCNPSLLPPINWNVSFDIAWRVCPYTGCNHLEFPDPYLIEYDCGKLAVLSKLLHKLKNGGHRCLLFTQMTRMLDILEYWVNLHHFTYRRLDASVPPKSRQYLIDDFNNDSSCFIFLLSTRAGGLGINLTGADCVIFYDTDWNPMMDAQAQDRAHRIGQTREVHIFRLVSEYTIEENMLKRASQKRLLDSLVSREGGFVPEFFRGKASFSKALDKRAEIRKKSGDSASIVQIKHAEDARRDVGQSEDGEYPENETELMLLRSRFSEAIAAVEEEADREAAIRAAAEEQQALSEFLETSTSGEISSMTVAKDMRDYFKLRDQIRREFDQLCPAHRVLLKRVKEAVKTDPLLSHSLVIPESNEQLAIRNSALDYHNWADQKVRALEIHLSEDTMQDAPDILRFRVDPVRYKEICQGLSSYKMPSFISVSKPLDTPAQPPATTVSRHKISDDSRWPRKTPREYALFLTQNSSRATALLPAREETSGKDLAIYLSQSEMFCHEEDRAIICAARELARRGVCDRGAAIRCLTLLCNLVSRALFGRKHSTTAVEQRYKALSGCARQTASANNPQLSESSRERLIRYHKFTSESGADRVDFMRRMTVHLGQEVQHLFCEKTVLSTVATERMDDPWQKLTSIARHVQQSSATPGQKPADAEECAEDFPVSTLPFSFATLELRREDAGAPPLRVPGTRLCKPLIVAPKEQRDNVTLLHLRAFGAATAQRGMDFLRQSGTAPPLAWDKKFPIHSGAALFSECARRPQ
eukprot:gnl/Chilomastix_cuspidata/2302.p1 GENE.gnl/Chilomastix_cuspidata/2302~~gnl/Chilomastix_cuspidata/2302.p1  ORF type:complete len:1670 (+),score=265.78 gnl/Chilomastix_cuspidata/2302:78-5087(+)